MEPHLFYLKKQENPLPCTEPLFAAIYENNEVFYILPHSDLSTAVTNDLWACLKITNIIDFDTPGILNQILTPIASIGVSVLVISGFNTDYIFFKEKYLSITKNTLIEKGYEINE
jgi:hypothetical protein